MSNVHEFAIPLLQESFIEFGVTLVAAATVSVGALSYFRRVRLERPPVGTFNGRDIGILLALIIALPFLYAVMPGWLLTCFLAVTFSAALAPGHWWPWAQLACSSSAPCRWPPRRPARTPTRSWLSPSPARRRPEAISPPASR